MSKAMLIIDEPSSCIDCPCYFTSEGYEECEAIINTIEDIDTENGKPTWCPLRPVPTLKEDNSVIYIERYEGYLEGWNDCVKEMLGGGE